MKSMKELREKLLAVYLVSKKAWMEGDPAEISLKLFKEAFGDELYAAAIADLKRRENESAQGAVQLTSTQAVVLKAKGRLMDRINVRFRESNENLLETMAGYEVLSCEVVEVKGKKVLELTRSNGVDESKVYADMPELEQDQVLFVQEPFAMVGDAPKTWTEMSQDERAEASKSGNLMTASRMTKAMLKRRVKVEAVNVRHDNRTGWIEAIYVEVAPFERSEEERIRLMEEFQPTSIEDAQAAEESALDKALSSDEPEETGVSTELDDETMAGLGDPPEDRDVGGELANRDDEIEVPE